MKYESSYGIKLGMKVKDKVTGFEGMVVHLYFPMHDAEKVGIQAPLKADGTLGESYTIDAVGVMINAMDTGISPIDSQPLYNNGDVVRSKIQKVKGTIVGVVVYLNGCVNYTVCQHMPKGGKTQDYPDVKMKEGAIELIKKAKNPVKQQKAGGPMIKNNQFKM